MKLRKNDKVITAFLVSLGLFTISQAKNYVVNLSKKDSNKWFDIKKEDWEKETADIKELYNK